MQKLQPQLIVQDVSSGVINGINSKIAPPNSVKNSVNLIFDEEYGSAVLRKGCTILGSRLVGEDNTINGLYQFIDSEAGSDSHLIASVNEPGDASSSIYYYNGANWISSLTGDTANLKTRFVTFLDYVVRLNGTDEAKAWDGSGAWDASGTVLELDSFPKGKYGSVYKDQICVSGVSGSPDSVFISTVPNSITGAISWGDDSREIIINPEDNSNITGMGEIANLLIIFKDRSMYRWNNRSIEADEVTSVGCSSQESIAVGAGLMFFFNPKGVWVTTGDQPVLISRPVKSWIDGMSASFYDDVAGYCDNEHYFCSIGDCTVDGKTYNNVVLRYTIGTKEWAVLSYANEFRVFTLFIDSGAEKIVGGDTTGRVLQIESSSLTDNGSNINFELETQDIDFGSRGIVKDITEKVLLYGKNTNNVTLSVRTTNTEGEKIQTIGSTVKDIACFNINVRANLFNFIVTGTSSTARYIFRGLELPNVTIIDYV